MVANTMNIIKIIHSRKFKKIATPILIILIILGILTYNFCQMLMKGLVQYAFGPMVRDFSKAAVEYLDDSGDFQLKGLSYSNDVYRPIGKEVKPDEEIQAEPFKYFDPIVLTEKIWVYNNGKYDDFGPYLSLDDYQKVMDIVNNHDYFEKNIIKGKSFEDGEAIQTTSKSYRLFFVIEENAYQDNISKKRLTLIVTGGNPPEYDYPTHKILNAIKILDSRRL